MAELRGKERQAHELRQRANEKMKNRQYAAALIDYTRALEQTPGSAPLLSNRAASLQALGAYDDAIIDLTKAVSKDPNFVAAWCRLGYAYLHQGNTIRALQTYVEAVKITMKHARKPQKFMSELKESIKLAESRARQQGYTQDYIDELVPDTVRMELDNYRSLSSSRAPQAATPPMHMMQNFLNMFANGLSSQPQTQPPSAQQSQAQSRSGSPDQPTEGQNQNTQQAPPPFTIVADGQASMRGPNGEVVNVPVFNLGPNEVQRLMTQIFSGDPNAFDFLNTQNQQTGQEQQEQQTQNQQVQETRQSEQSQGNFEPSEPQETVQQTEPTQAEPSNEDDDVPMEVPDEEAFGSAAPPRPTTSDLGNRLMDTARTIGQFFTNRREHREDNIEAPDVD